MERDYARAYAGLYKNHWWWRARERILLRRLTALLGHKNGNARILDVGCGAGLFFSALQKLGHVDGIESDALAVAQSGQWRERIIARELDEEFRPVHLYDAILMLDLLEHLAAPEQLLQHARTVLAPGGRCVITVPAFQWLWTSHDRVNHHFRRYTARDLEQTLSSAGFVAEETKYLFQSLVIAKLFARGAESLGVPGSGVPRVPSPLLNDLLQHWYESESALAGWLPFGTSILAIARVL